MRFEQASPWRIVALLFTASLAARATIVWATGFDGLYGQDAFAYLDQAMALRAAVLQGVPVPPGFSWPQGYPALAAVVSLVTGPGPMAPQLVSMVMGSAVAPLTFLVGRRIFPRQYTGAAVFAAILTTVGGIAVLSSIVSMSDATGSALILLSMWTVLEFANAPNRWPLLVVAVTAGGAAVATRWALVLVGPALAIPALTGLKNSRQSHQFVPAVIAAVGAGLTALEIGLVTTKGFDFSGYFHGWNLLNAVWGPIPEIPAGSLAALTPGLVHYSAPMYHPAYIGPLLFPFALFGMRRLWIDQNRFCSLTLILWAAVPLTFFMGLPLRSLRFGLTNAVPFALWTAYGVWDLHGRPRFKTAVRIVTAVSFVMIIGWGGNRIAGLIATADATNRTVTTVEALVPNQAVILAFDITLALRNTSSIETLELFDQDEVSLERLITNGRPLFLLTQPEDIERRWRNLAPGINIEWLKNRGSLEPIDVWGSYTLQQFHQRPNPPVTPTGPKDTS